MIRKRPINAGLLFGIPNRLSMNGSVAVAPSCRAGRLLAGAGLLSSTIGTDMHDLQFVRTNLALIENKLRARGQDPEAILGNFRTLDEERRQRITDAETLKAQRNALSEEVGRRKRAKEDASALMEE